MRPLLQNGPRTLLELVERLQGSGRYTFARAEALETLQMSEEALKKAARRLSQKGRLTSPRRGFFVIVPVEYRSSGAPPAPWFIDDLMRFEERPYYVALLSAAALHGAAHQQPQEFQVMTDVPLRPSTAGRSRLRFFSKRRLGEAATMKLKTETGEMVVATPETTALDLVRHADVVGGAGSVVTVFAELAEKIDAERLVQAAEKERSLAIAQRVGFLLELVEAGRLLDPLEKWIAQQRPRFVPLRPDQSVKDAAKDLRWMVLVNDDVVVDL